MRPASARHQRRSRGRVRSLIAVLAVAVLCGAGAKHGWAEDSDAATTGRDIIIPFPAQGGPFVAFDGGLQRDEEWFPVMFPAEVVRRLLRALPMGAPLDGFEISSIFGGRLDPVSRKPAIHAGIDLKARRGTPVRVRSKGVVVFAGWQAGYGRLVEIDHGMGVRSLYGHLAKITVRKGQTVKDSQVVGRVGSSGRSTGPHLHYEIRINGIPRNPLALLSLEASSPIAASADAN